jgi:hypothetical protein
MATMGGVSKAPGADRHASRSMVTFDKATAARKLT